jgi:IclR family acetate operon transcriptional repressor
MPVKPSQSGARILTALEKIAENQPVGVSELARLLDTNLAAAQRAIATLAEEGWIRMAVGKPTRWELTAHIHIVAQHAYGTHDLRRRARGPLEELWKATNETVLLNVPDGGRFIVIDVFESPHHLRSSVPVGFVVPTTASATAWAILPYMTPTERDEYLEETPDKALLEKFGETVVQGFAVSRGDVFAGSNNIAAPIFEIDGRPIGVVLISLPNDRAGPEDVARLGQLVKATALRLSRGAPSKMVTSAVLDAAA